MQKVPPRLRAFAKEQRRDMTRAEIIIWRELRASRFAGMKFKRQVPIGPYIVDFVCFAARMVVELDGEPHEKPEQQMHDARRDAWLTSQGFRVLRFTSLCSGKRSSCSMRLAERSAFLRTTPLDPSPRSRSARVDPPPQGGGS